MRKFLPLAIILTMIFPLSFSSFLMVPAVSVSVPLIPHDVRVLVVSPENIYWKGGHYLISDLAGYGFNVTQDTSDDGAAVDYRTDWKTSNLSEYDVVILHGGYFGAPPTMVTAEEVSHFTDFNGILIVIGNALFGNETSGQFWNNVFTSEPIQKLGQRLGVDFTGYLGDGGAYHNNGTFDLVDNSMTGLPSSLSYFTADPASINFQINVTTINAQRIYDFTTTSPKSGRTTAGVTYYKNPATGAVGIYIQGSYIYAKEYAGPKIEYFGLTEAKKRSSLMGSLIAHAIGADINTIVKPQPLATIRLDEVGSPSFDENYLNSSLSYFNSVVDLYGIEPSISFTDYYDLVSYYWKAVAPSVLGQLKTIYRDWEYSSFLQRKDPTSMNQSQIEHLIDSSEGNYTALGMDLFSTVVAPLGSWNPALLDAMANKKLYLLELSLGPNAPTDWWNIQVNSSVLVHTGAEMAGTYNAENFTQISKDILHFEYFNDRDKWALAVLNGFPSFFYSVPNFRSNEVGTYSLQTVYSNLTSEIPDIKFVPLVEAGLYFANRWVHISNPVRQGSTIEFDLDSSKVPEVADIGKGMTWLRINANETISEVFLDGRPWYYFDDHSVRLPTNVAHVKVILGTPTSPTVSESFYKVIDTVWSFLRFKVTVSAAVGLNITIRLHIPEVGAFNGTQWNVFSPSLKWGYSFDSSSRILSFWAISDGSATFEAGPDVVAPVFWKISHSPALYNSPVTIRANITDLRTYVENAILSYRAQGEWTNVTMVLNESLYVGDIPAFPYQTKVQYKLYAFDIYGNARMSDNFNYTVTDKTPPEMGNIEWGPGNPSSWETVYVRVNVTEPESASGVRYVLLYYWVNLDFTTLNTINMTRKGDMWSAVIPGQSGGRTVYFFVYALDNANNPIQSDDVSYTVGGSGLPISSLILIGIVVLAGAGAAAVVYLKKFRKGKATTNVAHALREFYLATKMR